jgi:uncharacterized membrane protein
MEKHIKVARVHRGLAFFYGFSMVFAVAALIIQPIKDFTTAEILFFAILAALLLLHFFVAKGAREKKPWARGASIAIASLMLLGFPVGTIIGVYLLSNAVPSWEPEHL